MNTSWKTVRVFISSTFRDMQAERDWLVRFVFPKLREELLRCHIHLVDVDLRWGVTSDQDALGVCREVIDECHPRFMCILGGRYGWVPEGSDASITADEVHYGVLGRETEKRGYAFFYFREEVDTLAIPEADARRGGYREFAQASEVERHGAERAEAMARERAGKLETLKKAIIAAGLPVFLYHAGWSAREQRITGLVEFGDRVFADLLQSLKDDPGLAERFAEGAAPAPDEFAEEAEQMEAFIEERTGRFVIGSREPLLRDMLAFATTDGTPNIFIVTGDPGSGKSALLAKFTRDLSALHTSSFILPTFVGASSGSTDLRRTLRRLCHELALATGNTEPQLLDIKELITHFHALLADAAGRRRVILVFDALNQFDATDGAHWLTWLPCELPPGVRIVASLIAPADGQPEHQTLTILRTRPGTRMEKLEPLTEADTLAIIEGSLRRYAKRLSPEQLAALLAKPAGRLPLFVLTALEELRTLGTYEEITARIRTLPGDARALFGWILTERLARDPGFRDRDGRPCGATLVEKFAACLGVSRHGLSLAELTALLYPGDPLGNVAALLRLLRPYLMRRGELLDFYHSQFREAASSEYLHTEPRRVAAHRALANYFHDVADPGRTGEWCGDSPHALSELCYHQRSGGEASNWATTLSDILFLDSKLRACSVFDVLQDFDGLPIATEPRNGPARFLTRLRTTLRRNASFLDANRSALFTCLWNRLHGSASCQPLSDAGPMLQWPAAIALRYPAHYWLRSVRPLASRGALAIEIGTGFEDPGEPVVAVSGAAGWVGCGLPDGTIAIWDTASGREIGRWNSGQASISSLVVSFDAMKLVSGGTDGSIIEWDLLGATRLRTFQPTHHSIQSLQCLDNVRIAAASSEGIVFIVGEGSELVFRRHQQGVEDTYRISDSDFGPSSFELLSLRYPVVLASSATHGILISASRDGLVCRWQIGSGTILWEIETGECAPFAAAVSEEQSVVALGLSDGTIQIRNAVDGCHMRTLPGHSSAVTFVTFEDGGRHLASCGHDDRTVRRWIADTGELIGCNEGAHDVSISDAALAFSTNALATVGPDHFVRLWNLAETSTPVGQTEGYTSRFLAAAHSRDGAKLVTGAKRHFDVWDAERGKILASFDTDPEMERGWGGVVRCFVFDETGENVIFGDFGRRISVWSLSTGALLSSWETDHERELTVLALSPDGRFLASGDAGGAVRVWAGVSNRPMSVAEPKSLIWPVKSLCFSPSSEHLSVVAEGCSETNIRILELAPGGHEWRVAEGTASDGVPEWARPLFFPRTVASGTAFSSADLGIEVAFPERFDGAFSYGRRPQGRFSLVASREDYIGIFSLEPIARLVARRATIVPSASLD